MTDKILSLSKQLISIRSYASNRRALEKILKVATDNLKGFTLESFENKGSKSILVYSAARRPKKFRVILNGHLDITPGKEHQYQPKIEGSRLFGAGALDMKSSVACLIEAFKQVSRKVNYPLGLQLVTDEQVGGFRGTKFQIERGVRADFVIAGEATNLNIVNEAKGILWLKISTHGKTAHSAYPWAGKNAILKMNQFIAILDKQYPTPKNNAWVTTVNVSKIETSNCTFNKIPDNCTIWLDIRYVSGESDTIVNNIKKMLPEEFEMKIVEKEPGLLVDKKNLDIQLLKESAEKIIGKAIVLYGAQGSSDARHFMQVKCPGIEFGPVGGGIGSDKEWVDTNSLSAYIQILKIFLLSL